MELNALQPSVSSTWDAQKPKSLEEVADQFEEILTRQFVDVMTKDLFGKGLSGENGPSWMKGQGDIQRDTLADVLTTHLVDQGTLGISELLQRQWQGQQGLAALETRPDTPERPPDAASLSIPGTELL